MVGKASDFENQSYQQPDLWVLWTEQDFFYFPKGQHLCVPKLPLSSRKDLGGAGLWDTAHAVGQSPKELNPITTASLRAGECGTPKPKRLPFTNCNSFSQVIKQLCVHCKKKKIFFSKHRNKTEN